MIDSVYEIGTYIILTSAIKDGNDIVYKILSYSPDLNQYKVERLLCPGNIVETLSENSIRKIPHLNMNEKEFEQYVKENLYE